jgi:hypothetical protein
MQTIFRRIAAFLLPGFAVVVVISAATASADDTATQRVNPVVMAQSLRHQLADAHTYQFAISVDGRLEGTGEHGDESPLAAVATLRNGAYEVAS